MLLGNVVYMPQLKWKAGEVRALASLPAQFAHRTLPILKITPGGGFDSIEQRVISTLENVSLFGRRLSQAWGRRLAFLDAELIDDEKHSSGLSHHPLTELVERARLEGACVGPVVQLGSSDRYNEAVRHHCHRECGAPIVLRLGLSELERVPSLDTLRRHLAALGAATEQTVLLVDAGPIHVEEPAGLVHLIAAHLAGLAPQGTWLHVFWGATTFPNKPKLHAGQIGRFSRGDWKIFEAILQASAEFAVTPSFSDYALEFPGDYQPIHVPPTAHFRYSTEQEYLIFKGATTRKPNGYSAIFPVAEMVVSSPEFTGRDFSAGDAYIAGLRDSRAKTGNASMWRWASTDHHFRLVHSSLASALRLPSESFAPAPVPAQLALV